MPFHSENHIFVKPTICTLGPVQGPVSSYLYKEVCKFGYWCIGPLTPDFFLFSSSTLFNSNNITRYPCNHLMIILSTVLNYTDACHMSFRNWYEHVSSSSWFKYLWYWYCVGFYFLKCFSNYFCLEKHEIDIFRFFW
jgi:hypothetical protein